MPPRQPKSLEELRDQVIDAGGVLTISMRAVRNAYGAQRLGAQIRQNISEKLRGLGIGHVDEELPELRDDEARFFHIGSPAGRLIEAVVNPGSANDERIRAIAAGEETAKLDRIREIVCD